MFDLKKAKKIQGNKIKNRIKSYILFLLIT